MKEFLSKEQTKEYRKLGFSPDFQVTSYGKNADITSEFDVVGISDLFGVLPQEIDGREYTFCLDVRWDWQNKKWVAGYENIYFTDCLYRHLAPELIDALFELVKECVKEDWIKTKG